MPPVGGEPGLEVPAPVGRTIFITLRLAHPRVPDRSSLQNGLGQIPLWQIPLWQIPLWQILLRQISWAVRSRSLHGREPEPTP